MWHRNWKIPGWLWRSLGLTAILAAALALATCPAGQAQSSAAQGKTSFVQAGGYQAAPGDYFGGGTDWLNTGKRLTAGDLRGRVVLLDFWTLC